MSFGGPKHYRSMEEFEREELSPHKKCGWSLDDLYLRIYLELAQRGDRETPQLHALRDRIDVVVKALHFNTRFLGDLVDPGSPRQPLSLCFIENE